MLRAATLVVGALLLAACAPSTRTRPSSGSEHPSDPARRMEAMNHRDARESSDGVRYLRGIEQPQVHRLATLSSSEQLTSDSVMRDAMIAGVDELYVAMTAFVQAEYFALDMIVVNHRDKAIQLHRKDLKLYDASGRALTSLNEFPGAEQLGLRGAGRVDPPSFLYESPDGFELGAPSQLEPNASSKGSRSRSSSTRPRTRSSSDWRSMQPVGHASQAPATLHVASESGEAWWAYWKADGMIAYPVTAFVVFDEQQLMFQFAESPSKVAR